MRGNEANMLWEGLMIAVRDMLCLGLGFYIFFLLTAGEILF